MSTPTLSWLPSINKKIVITSFLAVGWLFIALIAANATGMISYEAGRYLGWMISLSLPIWVLLIADPNTRNLNTKDEKRAITAMVVTFVVFVIVALVALLQGTI
ncbi:hypothetical protein [Methanolobus profundi]|uniref:Uncharacterized protein n=1 Tax=Methanolobus profundi TaxID=487685 RepID=A0A1I4TPF2_9EURY|nr:hypothetical protein [Methanolobus profundi]SFM78463.1 hypothetical protein SAMN04488696_2372 [Methanolobus profundi]